MEYVKIKGLDTPVSKIFFGTAWIHPGLKEDADEQLKRYIEVGGNVIDTGRFYFGGKAEDYLKVWIQENPELRKKVMFTNKACHHYVDENNIHFPDQQRVTPECIDEDLHFSLEKLGLDHFDIYMLHRDNPEVPVGPLFDKLEQYHREGKITVYGVSNWSKERIEEAQAYCKEKGYAGIAVNSCSYSLATVTKPRWERTVYATDEYAKWCTEQDITILSWGSQGNGFFGNYPFPKGTRVTQDFVDAFGTTTNFEKFRRAKELAEERGVSTSNIAYAYIFNQGLKIAGITGCRNVHEFNNSLIGLDLTLTESEVDYLALRKDFI